MLTITLPPLPDQLIRDLASDSGITNDASILVTLENGQRLDYFDEVKEEWYRLYQESKETKVQPSAALNLDETKAIDRNIVNWYVSSYLAHSPWTSAKEPC